MYRSQVGSGLTELAPDRGFFASPWQSIASHIDRLVSRVGGVCPGEGMLSCKYKCVYVQHIYVELGYTSPYTEL